MAHRLAPAPPPTAPVTVERVERDRRIHYPTSLWWTWFREVRDLVAELANPTEPAEVVSYTVATLPTASSYTNHIVYVSDETGGATLAFSDGTNWRRVQDRAVVS